jgi:hypothetical protein
MLLHHTPLLQKIHELLISAEILLDPKLLLGVVLLLLCYVVVVAATSLLLLKVLPC